MTTVIESELTNSTRASRSAVAAAKQQEFFRRARELLKPSEVRLNHVPNWFRLRLLKAFKHPWGNTGGDAILSHAVDVHFRDPYWLDHWGSTDNGKVFVSEPYNLSPENVAELDSFAKKLGVQWYISACSWWFPGQTIRVAFFE